MTAITGTVAYRTVVTVVAASGDGAAIAAKFNGVVIAAVSPVAATAANSSGTVTITWADATISAADGIAQMVVTNMLAADTTLTSPITVTATNQGYLA